MVDLNNNGVVRKAIPIPPALLCAWYITVMERLVSKKKEGKKDVLGVGGMRVHSEIVKLALFRCFRK